MQPPPAYSPPAFSYHGLGNSGFKAPSLGVRTLKPFVPTDDMARVFGSSGIRPSSYSAWTNKKAFEAWQAGLDDEHPGKHYTYNEEQFDGDEVNDAVIRNSRGNVQGVNGIRFNRPNWADKYYHRASDGTIYNWFEKKFDARTQWNANNAVTTLQDIRKKFGDLVIKKIMDHFYPKGSKMVERRAPRSGIVAWVIAGLGGALADQQYLTANADAIHQAGITPTEALARLHRSKEYREHIIKILNPVVAAGGDHAESIRLFHEYIRRWLVAHGYDPSPRPRGPGGDEEDQGE
jgi:hypothetical protein